MSAQTYDRQEAVADLLGLLATLPGRTRVQFGGAGIDDGTITEESRPGHIMHVFGGVQITIWPKETPDGPAWIVISDSGVSYPRSTRVHSLDSILPTVAALLPPRAVGFLIETVFDIDQAINPHWPRPQFISECRSLDTTDMDWRDLSEEEWQKVVDDGRVIVGEPT